MVALTGCSATTPHKAHATPTITASSSSAPSTTPSSSARPTATHPPQPVARVSRSSSAVPVHAGLPLAYPTGSAREVVTVTAASTADTTAVLRTWTETASGWTQVGPDVAAHLGTDGMSPTPSETQTATPMGSFTLTQAFGHDADPGTRLPYHLTTPADWWISQPGRLYNTMQECTSACPFIQGDPNEHLYYETPYYDYAVVIDYNTADAGPIRQGAGSAFFLHVSVGAPTSGCVSIAADQLVRILRWLDPAQHPRILIGVG